MGKQTKEKRESREKEPAFKRKDEIANGRRDMASWQATVGWRDFFATFRNPKHTLPKEKKVKIPLPDNEWINGNGNVISKPGELG